MESVTKIASYVCNRYQCEYGERIDEMKLHKLMYLLQREAIVRTGEPLFDATFQAWKYGPVIPEVRTLYKRNGLDETLSLVVIEQYKEVFDYVFSVYAGKRSFVLSNITHGEYSWRHAREGYSKYADSKEPMSLEDIKIDAQNVKLRRELLYQYRLMNGV